MQFVLSVLENEEQLELEKEAKVAVVALDFADSAVVGDVPPVSVESR